MIVEQLRSYDARMQRAFAGRLELYRNRLFHYQTKLFYLSPQSRLRENRQYLADLEERFAEAMKARLLESRHRISLYAQRLEGLSPLRKLSQGYSYVADAQGRAVTSISKINEGDTLTVSVTDGTIETQVRSIRKEERTHVG